MSKLKEGVRPAIPMLISNWIFGMSIIEYPLGTQHRVISFTYTTILLMGYISLAVYSYPSLIAMTQEFEINPKIMNVLFYSHVILTISTVGLGWQRSKGFHMIVQRNVTADQLLESIGIPKNYEKRLRTQIGKYIGPFVIVVTVITINTLNIFLRSCFKKIELIALFVLNYPVIIMFIVDTTFINTIKCANNKFRKLNNMLSGLLSSTFDNPQHRRIIKKHLNDDVDSKTNDSEIVTVDTVYIICTTKKAHLELVKICQEADDTFGLHILLTVITSIAVITGNLYHVYILCANTNISELNFRRVIFNDGVWLIYYFSKIYAFSACCSEVSDESIKTGDLISEFYDEFINNEETQLEIRDFHMQMIKNAIVFETYGFIKLDLTLIQGIISSVTTYLMILGQFGNFVTASFSNSTCT